jgi:hypothetical protein
MRLHEDVAGILNFISYLNFGFFDLFFIPADCVGSKRDQLLFIILAPLLFLILVCAWFFIVALVKHGNWKKQILNVALVTFYLVLPGVCNSIFSVIQCEHFVTRDDPEEYSSYLKDDFSIECDRMVDSDYSSLLVVFFVSLILWPAYIGEHPLDLFNSSNMASGTHAPNHSSSQCLSLSLERLSTINDVLGYR